MIRIREQRILPALLFLASGFLAGAALPEFLKMGTGAYTGFCSLYSFQYYEGGEFQPDQLFWYIVSLRGRTLLFLWMSSFTAAGFLMHLLYGWWLTASAGMLLALFSLQSGWDGVLLFFCCILPQWLLYGMMWKREVDFLFWRQERQKETSGPESASGYRKAFQKLGIMLGLCLAGSACEAFLGMYVLKIFLQIFM